MTASNVVQITVTTPATSTTSTTSTTTSAQLAEQRERELQHEAQAHAEAKTITVTFRESGLPTHSVIDRRPGPAVGWSVVVNGQEYFANAGEEITVTTTGAVSFRVNDVVVQENLARITYRPSPSSGTAEAGQTVNVAFRP